MEAHSVMKATAGMMGVDGDEVILLSFLNPLGRQFFHRAIGVTSYFDGKKV
jgi:hypothetical protein